MKQFKTKFIRDYTNANGVAVYLYEVISNKDAFITEVLERNPRAGNHNAESGECVLFYSRTKNGATLATAYPKAGEDVTFEMQLKDDRMYINPLGLVTDVQRTQKAQELLAFARAAGVDPQQLIAQMFGMNAPAATAAPQQTSSQVSAPEPPAEDEVI